MPTGGPEEERMDESKESDDVGFGGSVAKPLVNVSNEKPKLFVS